jgi:dihydrofolate synthase/folylpolyglutamate synthase
MSNRDWLEGLLLEGMKFRLGNPKRILKRLGKKPHKKFKFKSIHVAGSNGKGSLCVQLSAAATASGLKTGLFTSPHLVRVEERVRIDGRPIAPVTFDRLLNAVRDAASIKPICNPTYFEATFLVAMLAFREAKVDRAIFETGMGGKLDATRLVDADLCILTTVSLEHTEYLGDTLAEIATEKVAIHRSGTPFIALEPEDAEVRRVIEEKCGEDLLPWWRNERNSSTWMDYGLIVERISRKKGWSETSGECYWPGRSPGYGEGWIDGVLTQLSAAHNAESLERDFSEAFPDSVVLLGMSKKADLRATMEPVVSELRSTNSFPKVVFTEPQTGRSPAVPVEQLCEMMEKMGVGHIPTAVKKDPRKAFEMAGQMAREGGHQLLVIGSVYLIGDLLKYVVERDGLNLWDELTVH